MLSPYRSKLPIHRPCRSKGLDREDRHAQGRSKNGGQARGHSGQNEYAPLVISEPREIDAKLLLVHVISDAAQGVPLYLRGQFYKELEKGARTQMQKLTRKHGLDAEVHRAVYLRARGPANAIVAQAKKVVGFHDCHGKPRTEGTEAPRSRKRCRKNASLRPLSGA